MVKRLLSLVDSDRGVEAGAHASALFIAAHQPLACQLTRPHSPSALRKISYQLYENIPIFRQHIHRQTAPTYYLFILGTGVCQVPVFNLYARWGRCLLLKYTSKIPSFSTFYECILKENTYRCIPPPNTGCVRFCNMIFSTCTSDFVSLIVHINWIVDATGRPTGRTTSVTRRTRLVLVLISIRKLKRVWQYWRFDRWRQNSFIRATLPPVL